MSLNAVTRSPATVLSMASRGSTVKSFSSMADSAAGRSGTSTSARKPSLPRLTPSTGASLAVREPHGAQHGAVAAEAHDQVGAPREFVRGNGSRGAVEPGDLVADAVDGRAVPGGPVEDGRDRLRGVALGVQYYADVVHRYSPYASSSRSHTSLIVGYDGTACQSRSEGHLAGDGDRSGMDHLAHPRPGQGHAQYCLSALIHDHLRVPGVPVGEQLGAGHVADLVLHDADGSARGLRLLRGEPEPRRPRES